ncbi:MAG: hypothetical protein ABIJ12_12835 [bacterium]
MNLEQGNLKISISELINIFRGSMISLIPWFEKLKIPWKDLDAYDDYDEIAEVLFKNMVALNLITEDDLDCSELPRYDFDYKDYSEFSFICIPSEDENLFKVFVGYSSKIMPFEKIDIAIVDKNNLCVKGTETINNTDQEFTFIRNVKGNLQEIKHVEVKL